MPVKDSDGNLIGLTEAVYATYTYDAWGKLIGMTDANGNSMISRTPVLLLPIVIPSATAAITTIPKPGSITSNPATTTPQPVDSSTRIFTQAPIPETLFLAICLHIATTTQLFAKTHLENFSY